MSEMNMREYNARLIEEYRANGGIVVIAADAGADKHPDWYYNLLAHPEVVVELGVERFPARAVIASAAERKRLIAANVVPYFPAQQEKTSREIPFVFLDRVPETGG
jgi:deazaflavin-dependent oxidoreductase (nitroreductase family)